MNEGQRAALKRYHQRLAEDIIVSEDLLGELYQVGIFEKGMIDMIRAERASDQVHKLLVLLPKRGPEAFERFVAVIERDYPWLATALLSAPTKTAAPATESLTHSRHTALGHHSKPLSSSTPALQDGVDGDIKKLVAAFIHRQFGQSKRISEKDKKSLEKFVNGQIQRERTM
ncbi:uncharacterized protein LOC101846089 [Aplysia californica]|uniref:Uncharacterized protein LOC101846089 n=1 Tax=Aplysia californica TaxID=6500 RepID=A0ABM0K2S3_APLCA|nr:uncharacterized protein LOC101846089 [Aplysia californica]